MKNCLTRMIDSIFIYRDLQNKSYSSSGDSVESINFGNLVVKYFHQYCKYIDKSVISSCQGWMALVKDSQHLIAFIVTGQTVKLLETTFISEKMQVQTIQSDYWVNTVSLISFA